MVWEKSKENLESQKWSGEAQKSWSGRSSGKPNKAQKWSGKGSKKLWSGKKMLRMGLGLVRSPKRRRKGLGEAKLCPSRGGQSFDQGGVLKKALGEAKKCSEWVWDWSEAHKGSERV